jgi:hypothetical protein
VTVIFAYAMVNLGILKITFNCFLTYKAIQTRPPVLLTEWDKCIEFLDNLHCTSKQCVLPHMPTVIPLFTCQSINHLYSHKAYTTVQRKHKYTSINKYRIDINIYTVYTTKT